MNQSESSVVSVILSSDRRQAVRDILSANVGQVLTPELAALIELSGLSVAAPFARAERIDRLTNELMGMKPAEIHVSHYFTPGVYAREITIPKGTVLVGAMHRDQNLAILSKGCMKLLTDDSTVIINAGDPPINCAAERANAAVALEDSVWTNFFPNPTNETDPDKLVEMVAFVKASEVGGGPENRQALAYAQTLELELEN